MEKELFSLVVGDIRLYSGSLAPTHSAHGSSTPPPPPSFSCVSCLPASIFLSIDPPVVGFQGDAEDGAGAAAGEAAQVRPEVRPAAHEFQDDARYRDDLRYLRV